MGNKYIIYYLSIYALALIIASQFDRIKKIAWYDQAVIAIPLLIVGGVFYYLNMTHRINDLAPWMNALPIQNSFVLILGAFLIFIWKTKDKISFLWKLVAANILVISVLFLGVIYHTGNAYDLREVSRTCKTIEDRGLPLAYLGNYAGQFDFIGRLDNPPQVLTTAQLFNWTKEHAEGRVIITFDGEPDFEKIKPEFTSWYRGSHIAILSSSDINRICKPQPNLCIEH